MPSDNTKSGPDTTDAQHSDETGLSRAPNSRQSSTGTVILHTRPSHEPPDGGLQAWLVIVGAFFVWFNSWGAINAFGVFQTWYLLELLPSYSASNIALIGAVQNFLVLFVGFLSGPLYDAGYGSIILGTGGFLTVMGTMALSSAREYYQVFLSQGLCVGLGWGLMFTPAASLPSRFFRKKLPLATGLASAGTGIGGIVYSVAFNGLSRQQGIGFPWAVRFLGFLALATLIFSTILMSASMQPPARRRQFIDWTAFKEVGFNAYLVGGIFTMIGLAAPYYYANLYAIENGMTSPELGFHVVTAINGGSFVGRLLPPFLALRIGVFNTFILSYLGTVTSCLCFIAARSAGSVFAIATLYGFFSGAVVALSPVTIVRMTHDPSLIGTRMGMAFALPSIGILIGSPVCGAILSKTGNFNYVWMFSGVCLFVGAMFMVGCRSAQAGHVFLKNV